jgi:DNA-directed RNA polymerase specialized sigma24 family protein
MPAPRTTRSRLRAVPSADETRVLLARMQDGDVWAFAEFYDLWSSTAWSCARCATRTVQQAEQVTLQVFERAWREPGRVATEWSSPTAWFVHEVAAAAGDV